MNKRGLIIKNGITIGDWVSRKGKKTKARVVAMLEGRYEGGVELDRCLGAYRYWSVDDLEKRKA